MSLKLKWNLVLLLAIAATVLAILGFLVIQEYFGVSAAPHPSNLGEIVNIYFRILPDGCGGGLCALNIYIF